MSSLAARAHETEVVVLDPLTIAGERSRADARDALRSVTPGAQPAGAGALPTLSSQLVGLPGVVMQESFGGFDPPRLTLRGSGLQSAPVSRGVAWTLDGLPLNAADGSFLAAAIEPALIEEIVAMPGASDPQAAVTALGGALHLNSGNEEASGRAWLSHGPDGFLRGGIAAHCHPIGDNGARVWGGVAHAAWDGWRPQSTQRRLAASAAVATRLGEHGPAVRLSLYAAAPRFDVPGPLTLAAATDTPQSISAVVAADRPRRETDFGRIALDLTWTHDTEDHTRLAIVAQHTDDWFRQLRANGIAATAGGDLTALLEMRRTAGDHVVRVGLRARDGRRDQTRWLNLDGATGTRFAALDLEASHAAVSIDDCWTLGGGWTIETGFSAVDAICEAAGTPVGATGRVETREFASRLALSWQAAAACTLTARAARAIEAPSFEDLLATRGAPGALTVGWTPLRAQQADTLELGVSGRAGAFAYTCTAYTACWDAELLRLADDSGAALGTVNASRTDHHGVEAALSWRLWGDDERSLEFTATHTWSTATFEDDDVYLGRRIAGLPPHFGSARLTWAGEAGLFASLGATWVGGTTWADHANTLGYSGSTLVQLRAGWMDRRGWSVHVDVDNLLDRATIASTSGVIDLARNPATTALFLPGLPRQVRCGFSWIW
ncbi:MAG: TonB-dependent receptor [Opitutaceae bacterium]|nr:TonB-dependent receptor [Opitutaceae bacterium]